MKSFLAASICDGMRPKTAAGESYFTRNALLTKLMSDRTRVRYLLAPTCFGKTALACTYAELNFEFHDTSWISAQSPCFLRDLDAGIIAEGLMELVAERGLIVLDDVPPLNPRRAAALWKCCSRLVRSGREVLVSSTPGANPLRRNAASCVVVEPRSFLLTDEELALIAQSDPALDAGKLASNGIRRIPGLVFADERDQERFLVSAIADGTDWQNALLFLMLVLQDGTFADLARLAGGETPLRSDRPGGAFPYLAIDTHCREFSARGFSLHAVLRAFQPRLRCIAHACSAASGSQLALRLADELAAKRLFERAAHIVNRLCPSEKRAQWLGAVQEDLMEEGGILPLEDVFASLAGRRESMYTALKLGSAIRRALLNGGGNPLKDLSRIARSAGAARRHRLIAASFALLLADDAAKILDQIGKRRETGEVEYVREHDEAPPALLAAWSLGECPGDALPRVLDALPPSPQRDDALALACALRLSGAIDGPVMDRARTACQSFLGRSHVGARITLSDALLAKQAEAAGIVLDVDRTARGIAECYLAEQRAALRRRRAEAPPAPSVLSPFPLPDQQPPAAAPPIYVQLFGRFRVTRGAEAIDEGRFSRQKTRQLLSLLIIERGRDVACSRLAAALWPDSSPDRANHNFSNILCKLKRALALPNGDCPYIVRAQGIVRLDTSLVESDVGELFDLCRALSRKGSAPEGMVGILERLRGLYVGELLPGSADDLPITHARIRCRDAAVDAVLGAAGRLREQGDVRMALDFGRQALEWGPDREDCYQELMVLQSQAGQRPAAIETWTRYVERMRSLGMDPSARLHRLYLRIIGGDDIDD